MIPPWLLEKVAHPPSAGAGVHGWLFSCARHLHAHLNEDAIIALLSASVLACGRPVPERELKDAVKNSREVAWRPTPADGTVDRGRSTAKAPSGVTPSADVERWPAPSQLARRTALRAASDHAVEDAYDLWEVSPYRLEGVENADDWIDRLFPEDNPWLCVMKNHAGDARTRRREKWLFVTPECSLIVPSPMTGPSGINKSGERAHRCLENTGPRRWLIIEFDSGTADDQAQLHWHLEQCAMVNGWPRLVMAVHSGGKSIHGWYGPITDDSVARELFAYARYIGADTATWTPCQPVRMPAGTRENGNPQLVFYYNFKWTNFSPNFKLPVTPSNMNADPSQTASPASSSVAPDAKRRMANTVS